ncbi:hypothetical protein LBMAG33_3020 [Candidatus Levyibacteriota bacterium]|nr:hypothetical protein LBMAG33_3020 [Candidatus Levybacteria bacterium]
MNKNIVVAVIALVLVGVGIYFYTNSKNMSNEHGEDTTGQPAAQSHRGYDIEVTSNTQNIQPQKSTTITYKIKNDKDEILKDFEIAHEKIMHFILVRKDLQQFQHLHPDYNESTGEFKVDVTFPTDGPYRIFPDFTPGEENPQKLPVTVFEDINVGNISKYQAQAVTADTQSKKTFEGYDITFTVPASLKKQQELTYELTIQQGGKPVANLQSYLGALGHSVILKEGTLDFIHTHALEGDNAEHGGGHMESSTTASTGPDIKFATTFPESGKYKIFTQFQHQGKVLTTDYIIDVN